MSDKPIKFTSLIDNYHTKKWGISLQEAYVFSWIYDVPSWAKTIIIDNEVWYFASKTKAISDTAEILTSKTDTMYRYYKKLEEAGLIENKKIGAEDYIRITKKGKEWNSLGKKSEQSENNPTQLGFKSEQNSDLNPTYYSISDYSISNKEIHEKKIFEKNEKEEKTTPLSNSVKVILETYNRIASRDVKEIDSNTEIIKFALQFVKKKQACSLEEAEQIVVSYLQSRWRETKLGGGFMDNKYYTLETLFRKTKFGGNLETMFAEQDFSIQKTEGVRLASNSIDDLLKGLEYSNYNQSKEIATRALNQAKTQEEMDNASRVVDEITRKGQIFGWDRY